MNSNVETTSSTDLLRLLMKRALEGHDAVASSDQLPDNTAQRDPLLSQSAAILTSEGTPSTGTLDRSKARQDIWLTFLQKYVLASAELESFISDQELQIETLKRSMVEQKAKLTVLERQLEDREREVADRERSIFKRESGVVERERVVAEREQTVAEREQAALATQEKIPFEREQLQKNKDNARSGLPPYAPPIQWSPIVKNRYITLDATGLKATCADTAPSNVRPVVMGTQPLGPDRMYFELSVIKRACNDIITIGLTRELPELNKTLGWSETWAYHSDDGGIFLGRSSKTSHCAYETYTEGDVVGCGIDNQNQLFFTKNGKRFIGRELLSHTSGAPLWPVTNICSAGEIIANFGPNFVYKF